MQELATATRQDGPGGLLAPDALLTRRAWQRSLGPFRLPRYRALIWAMGDLGRSLRVTRLWTEVFGDQPPAGVDSEELIYDLVWRVNRELFPVDLSELDHYQEMLWSLDYDDEEIEEPAESILDLPIPIQGYGIPWEVAGLDEFEHAGPLLAVCAAHLPHSAWFTGSDFEASILGDVNAYWVQLGMEPPTWNLPAGQAGLARFRAALRLLPPPFDGLAGVLDCACKESNNLFINTVSGMYSCEYEDGAWDYAYNWNPDTIRNYAQIFARDRATFEAIDAYDRWYYDTPGAARHVVRLLAPLVAGDWHIEEDKIIFHD